MRIYIVTTYDDIIGNIVYTHIEECFSTKEKAYQFIRNKFHLSDDVDVDDYIAEMWESSGSRYDVTEYEVV